MLRSSSRNVCFIWKHVICTRNFFFQAKEYLLNLAKEKGWSKMKDISQKLSQGLICVARNKTSAAIVEVVCAVILYFFKTTNILESHSYLACNIFSDNTTGLRARSIFNLVQVRGKKIFF